MSKLTVFEINDKVWWSDSESEFPRAGIVTKIFVSSGKTFYTVEWFDGLGGVYKAREKDLTRRFSNTDSLQKGF